MTTALICSLCLLILTSSSVYCITSLFLVPSTLKTSNDLSIGSVFIFSSFTSCLLIIVCMYPESTSVCSHNFFLFSVLIFVYMLSSLSLSFLQFGITYQFWALDSKVFCTMPTWDLLQNPSVCHLSHYISLLEYCSSSSSILIYSLQQCILSCHIYSTCIFFFLQLSAILCHVFIVKIAESKLSFFLFFFLIFIFILFLIHFPFFYF